MKKCIYLLVFMFSIWTVTAPVFAQEIVPFDFEDDVDYDIIMQVTEYDTETVKSVNIIGLEDIGGRVFLVLKGTEFGTKHKGYIVLDLVKAILPVGVLRTRDAAKPGVIYKVP